MKSNKPTIQTAPSLTALILLIAGDLLIILSFVWVGRSSHNLAVTDIFASLFTALPFVIAWFLVLPWFGIYKAEIYLHWKKLIPRLLVGWLLADTLALILRAVLLGRSLGQGIMPTFAVVSFGYIGLLIVLWRLAYIWGASRRRESRSEAKP